jgi:hypothetical protein
MYYCHVLMRRNNREFILDEKEIPWELKNDENEDNN